jgi:hypothetical protein
MSESVAFTERFVADPGTARRLASAFAAERLRNRRIWILFGLVLLVMAAILLLGMDPDFRLGARVAWALIVAIVPTTLLIAAFAALAYVLTLRGARVRLFDGAVLESGFGVNAMVLRGPLSESRIDYAAVRSLTRHGEFVFLRQRGVPVVSVFPRELFPDDAIARINAAAHP